jgi:hypothetical protein
MPAISLTWATGLPLTIAVAAMLATLAFSVPAAFAEDEALRRAQAQGRFLEVIRNDIARASKRRELLRVVKHLIIVTGILISFTRVEMHRAIVLRNLAFALISILMLCNTTLDYRTKRRAIRFVESAKPIE